MQTHTLTRMRYDYASPQQCGGCDLCGVLICPDAPWTLGQHKYYHIFSHVAHLDKEENCYYKAHQSLRKARARFVYSGHVGTL